MTDDSALLALKSDVRARALASRNEQPDREGVSRRIGERLADTEEYRAARAVLFYIDARSEVITRPLLAEALTEGRTVVVPYCVGGELELFRLGGLGELVPGAYRILEPRDDLRSLPEKRVSVEAIDLIVVPGVAFDRNGGRLGHGFGYYDRLLSRARPQTVVAGLAFECQLFDAIPAAPHDEFVDLLVTEDAVYRRRLATEPKK